MSLKTLLKGCTLITVTANVPADLAGKEYYVVEQVAASEKVQLYTNGLPYAVLVERLQGGGDWSAALINAGGICPVVTDGAIVCGVMVKAANGGKATTAASGNLAMGIKRAPTAGGADGVYAETDLGIMTMP